jgi:hypothetical protein
LNSVNPALKMVNAVREPFGPKPPGSSQLLQGRTYRSLGVTTVHSGNAAGRRPLLGRLVLRAGLAAVGGVLVLLWAADASAADQLDPPGDNHGTHHESSSGTGGPATHTPLEPVDATLVSPKVTDDDPSARPGAAGVGRQGTTGEPTIPEQTTDTC